MTKVAVISKALTDLETIVESGFDAGMKAWKALRQINEARLYKERGFDTFESYLRDAWGVQRSYGYKMMQASVAKEKLQAEVGGDPLLSSINNERKLREFTAVPDDKLKDVFDSAATIASDSHSCEIKASHVREAKVMHGLSPSPSPSSPASCTPMVHKPLLSTSDPVVAGAQRRALESLAKLEFQLGNLGLSVSCYLSVNRIRKEVEAIK